MTSAAVVDIRRDPDGFNRRAPVLGALRGRYPGRIGRRQQRQARSFGLVDLLERPAGDPGGRGATKLLLVRAAGGEQPGAGQHDIGSADHSVTSWADAAAVRCMVNRSEEHTS